MQTDPSRKRLIRQACRACNGGAILGPHPPIPPGPPASPSCLESWLICLHSQQQSLVRSVPNGESNLFEVSGSVHRPGECMTLPTVHERLTGCTSVRRGHAAILAGGIVRDAVGEAPLKNLAWPRPLLCPTRDLAPSVVRGGPES